MIRLSEVEVVTKEEVLPRGSAPAVDDLAYDTEF